MTAALQASDGRQAAARKPGPVARASRQAAQRAGRVAAPYAAGLAAAGTGALAMHSAWPALVVSGAVGWHALLQLHEGYGWHRSGGRAARRRRRRYQGTASAREIQAKLSLSAARRRAEITRPSIGSTRGLVPAQAGVLIGKGGRPARALMGTHEDFYLVFAGPRKGKTGWMSGTLADAPGFALTTSTRVDVWAHTSVTRERRGPVCTLNPGGDGGVPTTLAWDLLDGCAWPAMAIERAGYLMDAAPHDASGRDAWWDHQGAQLLRLLLHAGALAGADARDVAAWARDPASSEPVSVLDGTRGAAPGWGDELAALADQAAGDGEFLRNVSRSALVALSWLSDPAMAAVACPRAGESLDAVQLLAEGGTVYVIGANQPHNPLRAYFACLTAHFFGTCKRVASVSPGLRLDPPAMFVIDEPAITCPVPLDAWSAEAGGHGITLVTGVQSPAQLARQWGPDGAKIIRDNASVRLMFGGHTDADELEAFSAVCGDADTWEHVRGPGGRTRQPGTRRLFPPERLRTLGEGQAVLLHRSARPVLATIPRVWERAGYEKAELPGLAAIDIPEQPAIMAAGEPDEIPGTAIPAVTGSQDEEETPEWQNAPARTRG